MNAIGKRSGIIYDVQQLVKAEAIAQMTNFLLSERTL
jgi:hypothetical protein